MSDNPVKNVTSPEPPASERERRATGWKPRVHGDLESNTNPFENFDITGASVLAGGSVTKAVTIQDATKDTAPLQGSKDISDDDYLGGEG